MGSLSQAYQRYTYTMFRDRAATGVWKLRLTTQTGGKPTSNYVDSGTWLTPDPNLIDHGPLREGDPLLATTNGRFAIGDRKLSIHPSAMDALGLTEAELKSPRLRIQRTAEPTKEFTVKAVIPGVIVEGTPSYYELIVQGAGQ